jgi:hypothetical protein
VKCCLCLFLNLTPLFPLSFGGKVEERGKIKKSGNPPLKRLADFRSGFDNGKSNIYDFSEHGQAGARLTRVCREVVAGI